MNEICCDSCGTISTPGPSGPECCPSPSWKAPCDRCGVPTRWMARGAGRKRTIGHVHSCDVDPKLVAEAEAKRTEAIRLEREQAEKGERYRALELAREQQDALIQSAVACYERKGGHCTVRPGQPSFEFCRLCEHVTKGRQPKAIGRRPADCHPRFHPVKMMEVDA